MEGVIAAIMVVLTGVLVVVWRAQVRRPERWRPWFREATWLRAMGWTAALTSAAAIGALLSGGREIALLAVTVGAVVLMVLVVFWSLARTFGEPDDTWYEPLLVSPARSTRSGRTASVAMRDWRLPERCRATGSS